MPYLETYLSSREAARALGLSYSVLLHVAGHELNPPPRRVGTNWVWSAEDLARTRAFLATRRRRGRPRKAVTCGH